MQRGEFWWASLPAPRGSGSGFRRPVVVIQSDAFNRSRIQTVIVAGITSNTRQAGAPGNVPLSRRHGRLTRESVVNVSQLLTLDRSYLTERVGYLPARMVGFIEDGLRLVLALQRPARPALDPAGKTRYLHPPLIRHRPFIEEAAS
jgi:mRNA interferase MazF